MFFQTIQESQGDRPERSDLRGGQEAQHGPQALPAQGCQGPIQDCGPAHEEGPEGDEGQGEDAGPQEGRQQGGQAVQQGGQAGGPRQGTQMIRRFIYKTVHNIILFENKYTLLSNNIYKHLFNSNFFRNLIKSLVQERKCLFYLPGASGIMGMLGSLKEVDGEAECVNIKYLGTSL